jgi:hypothetical protein
MTKIRVFRYIVCCVLFLAVWEICARVDDHIADGAPLFGNYGMQSMLTHDEFGVIGRPYGHYGKWKLNALGFRGPDIHSDTLKLICIGASETFGMGETAGMEYPRQLERVLNARRPDLHVEVVNVAYAGESLGAVSHRIDKIVDKVSPRIAVLYPSFYAYINDATIGQPDPVEWVGEQHGFNSRIKGKLLSSMDRMLPQWASSLRYRWHIWRNVRNAKVMDTIPETHVEQFRSDLRGVLDGLRSRHVCSALVTHATYFGRAVDPDEREMLTAWRRFEPTLADDGYLDAERRLNAVIRQEARARHLPLVEASNVLSGTENFTDWAHFTNRGSHQMANIIADKLVGSQGENSQQPPLMLVALQSSSCPTAG